MSGRDHRATVWEAARALAMGQLSESLYERAREADRGELFERTVMAQGLTGALSDVLDRRGSPVSDRIERRAEDGRLVRLASLNAIARIESVLASADVPWVVLKGPVLASLHENPTHRTFNDLDVLVRGRDLGRAMGALEGAGFQDVNQNWGNYVRFGVAETPLLAPGLPIDLHWHLVGLELRRRAFEIEVDAMLDRRQSIDLGPTTCPTLDAEDFLFHVALHAAMSGGTRFGWLRDVASTVRARPPDWEVFIGRVRPTGAGAHIGQILDRSRLLLSAEVPEDVPVELTTERRLWVRRAIDSRAAAGSGLPDFSARGLPVARASETPIRLLAEVLRRPFRQAGEQGSWDVGDADGPLYWGLESGGADGKQRYLEYASTHG